ncbi:hypothetical protein F0562_014736 [Nyssa sinensis]|uniref:Uncharacterized protein n=1 Tax=Nyssa sinensis TaxID=561372 RepID=A0A5J4ZPQ8_9ASTE|nr:hypothetical protein F0562_014736 [Nyssa sinensis]
MSMHPTQLSMYITPVVLKDLEISRGARKLAETPGCSKEKKNRFGVVIKEGWPAYVVPQGEELDIVNMPLKSY